MQFNTGTANNTVARDQPMLQATAQTVAAEAEQINCRLEVILGRLHPPQPHAVDTSRDNEGPRAVPTLFSMLGATGSLQQRTHQLLNEIELLV